MKCEWNGNEYVNDMKLNRKWFLYNWNGIEIKNKMIMKMKWQQIKNVITMIIKENEKKMILEYD